MALIATENLSSCPDCGAVVPHSRVELHEDWHKGLEQPAGVELEDWPGEISAASSSL